MSEEVAGISAAGLPRACVQLTPGRRGMRGGGGHIGDTGASRKKGGSLVTSVSLVKIKTVGMLCRLSPRIQRWMTETECLQSVGQLWLESDPWYS